MLSPALVLGLPSAWSFVLYISIPSSLLLLLIILFAHGNFQRLNDFVMSMIGRLLFIRVGPFPLIAGVLLIHAMAAAALGYRVLHYHENHPSKNSPLDVQLAFNSKAWRNQRNTYLICLSFVLWAMVYAVYVLKVQLDRARRMLVTKDAELTLARMANRPEGAAVKPTNAQVR